MNKAFTRSLLAGLIASLGACSSDPVDLGHDDSQALGSALSDYAGTWDGYAEAYEFSDDTDRVHLELAADGTGELSVGEADPLPAPDPEHAYPPSQKSIAEGDGVSGTVEAGFAYPVDDGTVKDNRIQMHSSAGELYREWCDLMTPHLVTNATPSYYACLPFAGFGTSNDKQECTNGPNLETVIDCGLTRCLSICECTADDCALAPQVAQQDIEIDATLEGDGDSFVGTLVLGSERITVRLTRE